MKEHKEIQEDLWPLPNNNSCTFIHHLSHLDQILRGIINNHHFEIDQKVEASVEDQVPDQNLDLWATTQVTEAQTNDPQPYLHLKDIQCAPLEHPLTRISNRQFLLEWTQGPLHSVTSLLPHHTETTSYDHYQTRSPWLQSQCQPACVQSVHRHWPPPL